MDKTRKKQLTMEYKMSKPEMGVFVYHCIPTDKHYVGWAQNIKGKMNSYSFRLKNNSHPNKNLQADWNRYGPDSFQVQILQLLPYDKNDPDKTDYHEELSLLRDELIQQCKQVVKL